MSPGLGIITSTIEDGMQLSELMCVGVCQGACHEVDIIKFQITLSVKRHIRSKQHLTEHMREGACADFSCIWVAWLPLRLSANQAPVLFYSNSIWVYLSFFSLNDTVVLKVLICLWPRVCRFHWVILILTSNFLEANHRCCHLIAVFTDRYANGASKYIFTQNTLMPPPSVYLWWRPWGFSQMDFEMSHEYKFFH